MTFFDLDLHTTASLHPDGEPDEFISTFTGYIVASGEDNVRRRVGKVLVSHGDHPLPKIRSTTQHPRTWGPGPRQ
jgi:hypothetical protein